jgi:hypothetical protein
MFDLRGKSIQPIPISFGWSPAEAGWALGLIATLGLIARKTKTRTGKPGQPVWCRNKRQLKSV